LNFSATTLLKTYFILRQDGAKMDLIIDGPI
jgi:hypothetical protein